MLSDEGSSDDSRSTIWLIFSANMLYYFVRRPMEVMDCALKRAMNFYRSRFLSISIYAFSSSLSYFVCFDFLGKQQLLMNDFISDFDYMRFT